MRGPRYTKPIDHYIKKYSGILLSQQKINFIDPVDDLIFNNNEIKWV